MAIKYPTHACIRPTYSFKTNYMYPGFSMALYGSITKKTNYYWRSTKVFSKYIFLEDKDLNKKQSLFKLEDHILGKSNNFKLKGA